MFLQEDVARRVFQQLLDALDYCHKRSIFHRYTSGVFGDCCLSHNRPSPGLKNDLAVCDLPLVYGPATGNLKLNDLA